MNRYYKSPVDRQIAAVDEAVSQRIAELISCDTELGHCKADELLCDILKKLGFTKTVEAFEKLPKWYA